MRLEAKSLSAADIGSVGFPPSSVIASPGNALRRLGRRHQYLTVEINELEDDPRDLAGIAARHQGVRRDHHGNASGHRRIEPERLRSEASFGARRGTQPIPASSGRTNRFRLNLDPPCR